MIRRNSVPSWSLLVLIMFVLLSAAIVSAAELSGGVPCVSGDDLRGNNLPSCKQYDTKIIYGQALIGDGSGELPNMDKMRNHCQARGGTFNECGSACAPGATICPAMCAITCDFPDKIASERERVLQDLKRGATSSDAAKATVTQMKAGYQAVKEKYDMVRHNMPCVAGGSISPNCNASTTALVAKWKNMFDRERGLRFKKICHRLTATSTLPQGFGAPFNPHAPARELLMKIHCDGFTSDTTLDVGNDSSTQYIYEKGYIWKNNKWQVFNLEGDAAKVGVWFVGKARADITLSDTATTKDTYVVSYTCQKIDGQWKCGCRDQICAVPQWQIQAVRTQ